MMGDSFSSQSRQKAAKQHRCEICTRPILPGTIYLKHAQVWDGDFSAVKLHEDCDGLLTHLAEYLDPYHDGMCWVLVEEISDAGLSAPERDGMLNAARGHFPHAVCRLEYRMRHWSDI